MAAPGAAAPGSGSAESKQKLMPRRDEQLLLTFACPNSCKQLGELTAIRQSTQGAEQSWSCATHGVGRGPSQRDTPRATKPERARHN